MNKTKIINSKVYPLICRTIRLFSLRVKLSTRGGNHLKISSKALIRTSRVKVYGYGNRITVDDGCRFRNCVVEIYSSNNSVSIGRNVMIYEGSYISVKGDNCQLKIDDGTTIGSARFFMEEGNTSIEVGKDCMFGRAVCLNTTDFHSIVDAVTRQRINPPENIRIGDHVWLGYGVTVSKGGEVGSNSVVGEQSLVTKAFTQNHVVIAGIPAKILKENIDWSRDKL